MIFKDIWLDVKAVQERDPAARSAFEVLLLYQGIHALIWHRIAHWFYVRHMFFTARLLSQIARFFTLIEIHPGAELGHGILIDHGSGVVIGETAVVGDATGDLLKSSPTFCIFFKTSKTLFLFIPGILYICLI